MKSKEEVIREAYGDYWIGSRDYVDTNGWDIRRIYDFVKDDFFDYQQISRIAYKRRPKSLKGIEDNNGWISVKKQLPKVGDIIISRRDLFERVVEDIETVTKDFLIWYDMNNITHWKYYESKPPLY